MSSSSSSSYTSSSTYNSLKRPRGSGGGGGGGGNNNPSSSSSSSEHGEEDDALMKFLKEAEELDRIAKTEGIGGSANSTYYVPLKQRQAAKEQEMFVRRDALNGIREKQKDADFNLEQELRSQVQAAAASRGNMHFSSSHVKAEDSSNAMHIAGVNNSASASSGHGGGIDDPSALPPPQRDVRVTNKSLFEIAQEIRKEQQQMDQKQLKQSLQQQAEQQILKEANQVQTNALLSNQEISAGSKYTESMKTSWKAPRHLLDFPEKQREELRKKWHIIVEGEDCPPPIKSFSEMKLPLCILDALKEKNIEKPTPIQVQGLPALFSGRDIIGIAFTGSGKTLTFSLPMIMLALEEEINCPIAPGEGPLGLILSPSRELARQTYEIVEHFIKHIDQDRVQQPKLPKLNSFLCIGGEDSNEQVNSFRQRGVHCIVATPGRLNDLLNKKRLNMDICRYIVLDEADRMLDLGFDEEVHGIINHFKMQKQTVLFSATMPQKFQDFAKKTLVKSLLINVGRAGAANLDVIQEVEYVKQEAKVVYLLECLKKTAPPVIIFCEAKGDVDRIHEYLLIKGVEAVSIHGGKDQAERNEAIKLFKEEKKDVLIATDIAAKGLDFPDIQHVINFDMPKEIENYVHRIGRTGRCGKTGVATTFINKDVEESILLDLKKLLEEAKQRVPPVLQALRTKDEDIIEAGGLKGCSFCGGLGHRITDCPKLDKDARRNANSKKDSLAKFAGGSEY